MEQTFPLSPRCASMYSGPQPVTGQRKLTDRVGVTRNPIFYCLSKTDVDETVCHVVSRRSCLCLRAQLQQLLSSPAASVARHHRRLQRCRHSCQAPARTRRLRAPLVPAPVVVVPVRRREVLAARQPGPVGRPRTVGDL